MSYLDKLMEESKGFSPGVFNAEIRHEPRCRIFKGKSCNCKPEIIIIPVVPSRK